MRTWRRTLRALALIGRARAARSGADGDAADRAEGGAGGIDRTGGDGDGLLHLSPGPHGTALREDRGPLAPARLLRPRQGRLGDCWLMAPMLALHETAPERLRALLREEPGGIVAVQLPGMDRPLRVDRRLPVETGGGFCYARRHGANPGWAGVLEKAIAGHVAGDYRFLQRGLARFGFELLLGERVRTRLALPSAGQILAWQAEGRALTASTHPLSSLVPGAAGPLPRNHVFAVVGADARSGHVHLRNPWRPDAVLVLDARRFRRGVLSVDVTAPLR
ncbi:crotonobetainyl-CoA--carnitine CoA-transferase [Brachybacterium saurashtrense]|uniref:Crotonobetainyl-CoA--carnitine CoA-transferase n=1 Tax=Brachybacterium saurashtrense TaxID=556288 RepID=A0A345YTE8_9MICO|nr:crotonobetainyl-CoA--carnitine CoA-transferase [Brachybacterium saurashtrense]RRR22152.1 crotonobetainyl-CoA--carnitine CoA-transferase [Brachybacterium saurashtrense]